MRKPPVAARSIRGGVSLWTAGGGRCFGQRPFGGTWSAKQLEPTTRGPLNGHPSPASLRSGEEVTSAARRLRRKEKVGGPRKDTWRALDWISVCAVAARTGSPLLHG
ncbi:hypothetical protein HPB50_018514 [Hyalomma asiaticum]|uniref:Uncharacterized protein n=1 Tax=Hyalomma asiaticum TaxID=266040 RepID=A0ACB7TMM6_HYAAI|nr:hypothetical protein HPB50_018514 [Hyalomma asiaticum]